MESDKLLYRSLQEKLVANEIANWVVEYQAITRRRFDQEVTFCLMTPQSKALASKAALEEVGGDITKLTADILGKNSVRFKNNKMANILLFQVKPSLHEIFISNSPNSYVRQLLYENIAGFGLKEASHLCRNCGRGGELAIIDRHILACYIKRYEEHWECYDMLAPAYQEVLGVYNKELALTPARYFHIEEVMSAYSMRLGIPSKYLDMIWWSEKSGHMYK